MINILIIDDSNTECLLLKTIFESDPNLKVIGIAKDGQEGVTLALKLKPDIITMDIVMPIMDGFEATKLIMAQHPIPIVIISSKINNQDLNITYRALSIGALTVINKPCNIAANDFAIEKQYIIDTIKAMAEIRVIRRVHSPKKKLLTSDLQSTPHLPFKIIAIGTSVGGPEALKVILTELPENFPLPIVIVQHMTVGFISGFASWLDKNTEIKVKIAEDNERLQKSVVYIAPDDVHMQIAACSNDLMVKLSKSPAISGFCPSVDVLMNSVAKSCGKNALGVLLTGMGCDGAEGLLMIKKSGGHTIIQDPKSAVVFGMASVAQSFGAVDKVIELDKMAEYLLKATL